MDTVKGLMTENVVTVATDASMQEASDLMRRYKIRHLPARDKSGRIVGVLSDRDVQRAMNASHSNADAGNIIFDPGQKVEFFMSWPVRAVNPDDTIEFVVSLMLKEKISCVLVVEGVSVPRGIITTDDMLRYLLSLVRGGDAEMKRKVGSAFEFFQIPTYE